MDYKRTVLFQLASGSRLGSGSDSDSDSDSHSGRRDLVPIRVTVKVGALVAVTVTV